MKIEINCLCCKGDVEGRPLVFKDADGEYKVICCKCMRKIEREQDC